MFDWYTTMNQPDWDGRTYALPLPSMMPPSQQNPMQRPQETNEMLPQGSVSGGLLGKLAEEGGAAASPAPSPAPMQRPAPQANPLTAPVSGPLAGPVMQPQMMPQQPLPMAVPYGWGQPLPQMAGQGTASAQAGKTGEDKGFLGNLDPGALALFAGLSMLGNNTGGHTFGQLVGKAGFDALAGAGGMAAAQRAAERQKRQDVREDMTTRIAQHKIDLERYKMAQEAAGMQALQGYLGGGAGGGMGGMMPSRPTLGGAYTGAAIAPDVDALIVKYSQEYGVDPNIARAVAMQESGGRHDVVSPAGAIGTFQLMPDTAKELGVDPHDLDQNIRGGIQYLKQMRDRYDGNWDRALYAYNWGPGNMDAYLKTGKGLAGRARSPWRWPAACRGRGLWWWRRCAYDSAASSGVAGCCRRGGQGHFCGAAEGYGPPAIRRWRRHDRQVHGHGGSAQDSRRYALHEPETAQGRSRRRETGTGPRCAAAFCFAERQNTNDFAGQRTVHDP